MTQNTPITVAHGDGIGPEIMEATLHILKEAGARIEPQVIEIGEQVYLRGNATGMEPGAFDNLRQTKVFLKAPITTPQGGGYKSLNVTTRKTFGLFANVRPCVSYHPFVETKHPNMDVVIVRENEEDLYAGIEHRQTQQVVQTLKLMSRPGCERISRYAFEYARANGRKKVTCFTKDNIMKMTDGMFHEVFEEVAKEYSDIENEHWIVDIGAAKLADSPENFDVVVLPNLYGDILSDVAAQIAGSVGLAGSANIGETCAMFEAIHGSAPRRAGQNLANPSGLLLGGVMMLVHIGQADVAERVHNAWLRTLEDGVHTYDVASEGVTKQKVGTKEFAQAVVDRLGKLPETLKTVSYATSKAFDVPKASPMIFQEKVLVGVDVFVEWQGQEPNEVGDPISKMGGDDFELKVISNRGQRIYPGAAPETTCTDHWRCRFMGREGVALTGKHIAALLDRVADAKFDCIKTENLYTFDGEVGYSSVHGA